VRIRGVLTGLGCRTCKLSTLHIMDRNVVDGGRHIPCNDPKLSSLWEVDSHPLIPESAKDLERKIYILLIDTSHVAMDNALAYAKTLKVPQGSNAAVDAKGS
jgi:hypothetical protein